jgi:hypothetical protein
MALGVSQSNQLEAAATVVTGYPFTLAGWFRVPDGTGNLSLMQIMNTTSNAYYDIFYAGLMGYRVAARAYVNGYATALSTLPLTTHAWHHVAGVFRDAASRTVYLDGGNQSTNTTARNFVAPNTFTLGGDSAGSAVNVAEAMVFDVALTEQEVAALAKGLPALGMAVGEHLVAYYDCLRALNRPGIGPPLTSSGAVVPVDHPPIFWPRSGRSCLLPYRVAGPYRQSSHRPLCRSAVAGFLTVGGITYSNSLLSGEVLG